MEKSKSIISKMLRLAIMISICLIFLEADVLSDLRNNIVTYFSFFKGKKEIIINIFIGILGSALLAILNEFIEYSLSKRKLEGQILKLCIEWDKDIRCKESSPLTNIKQFKMVGKRVCKYWNGIEELYFSYLPYFRIGLYLELIKLLYGYCRTYKDYFDNIATCKNEMDYYSKLKKYYKKSLSSCKNRIEKETIKKAISQFKKSYKLYRKSLSDYTEESYINRILEEANEKRGLLNTKLAFVGALEIKSEFDSVYQKDKQDEFEMELYRIKMRCWRQKINLLRLKISSLSPKNIILNIKYKRLENRYKDLN